MLEFHKYCHCFLQVIVILKRYETVKKPFKKIVRLNIMKTDLGSISSLMKLPNTVILTPLMATCFITAKSL